MFKKIFVLYYYFLNKFQPKFKTRDEFEKWQDKKVQKFLKCVLKKSPFYREYYKNFDIKDWKNFPLIDKKIMMTNFDRLNTKGISKEQAFDVALKAEKDRDFSPMLGDVAVGLSSGTSGNRGIFLACEKERYLWAGVILNKILPKSIFAKYKIALFLRANNNLYETIDGGNISFCFFDLLNDLNDNIKKLKIFNPDIIAAPPSVLVMLAKNYENINIKPQKIISVTEVLEDIDKKFIEHAFGQKIHQVYQATEGFIASTCKYGTLHINEDILCVQKEYIDKENGKFTPIITDFRRTTQPVIRYRLNDILTEKKDQCPCGSKHLAIEKIEGRHDDIFYLKKNYSDEFVAIFPDFISRAVIYASEDIDDYKVLQISTDEIQIYINKPEYKDKVLSNLNILFQRLNCIIPQIVFIDKYNKDFIKKFKRIENVSQKS